MSTFDGKSLIADHEIIILGNYDSGFLFQPGFKPTWEKNIPFIVLENHFKSKISCINTVDELELNLLQTSNKGIGLVNVQKCLDLIYKNRYYLKTGIVNGQYKVPLTIKLKCAKLFDS